MTLWVTIGMANSYANYKTHDEELIGKYAGRERESVQFVCQWLNDVVI